MAALLPKWIMRRYLYLHKQFSNKEFSFDDAFDALKKTTKDNRPIVSLVLSQLRRAGWLEISISQEDARKRVYTLKNMEDVFAEYLTESKKTMTMENR